MSGDDVPASSGMQSRLTVVSRDASPEEIAALVVALAAVQQTTAPPPRARSRWADPARMMRPRLAPGHGAWARSALPR